MTELVGGKIYQRDKLLDVIRAYGPVVRVITQTLRKYQAWTIIDDVKEFQTVRDAEDFFRLHVFHGRNNLVFFRNGAMMTVKRDRKGNYYWTYRKAV